VNEPDRFEPSAAKAQAAQALRSNFECLILLVFARGGAFDVLARKVRIHFILARQDRWRGLLSRQRITQALALFINNQATHERGIPELDSFVIIRVLLLF
jgi:hypothetical protein